MTKPKLTRLMTTLGAGVALLVPISSSQAQVSMQVNRVLQVQAVGTPAQNCAALRSALDGIPDNSADNRYLVRLEPGQYSCGSDPLFVDPGITLEGTGEQSTLIIGSVDSANVGLVHLLQDTELRALTVQNSAFFPAQAAYAVTAYDVFSTIDGILLEEVSLIPGIQADARALFAVGATFRLEQATLGGSGILLKNSDMTASFSIFDGVTVPNEGDSVGQVLCRRSAARSGAPLHTDCSLLP